jgi:predicted transcriptional regulator
MDRNDLFRYEILSHLEESPVVTNRIMTAKLGCSVRLTHELLCELVKKGCVNIKKHNPRRWDYLLTPSGIAEKARLAAEFLDFTFKFYHDARKRSSQLCRELAESGRGKVAFLGAGQLAEIAYLGVKEWGLELLDVYSESGEGSFLGLKAQPASEVGVTKAETVLVCLFDRSKPLTAGYLPEGMAKLDKMRWIFE